MCMIKPQQHMLLCYLLCILISNYTIYSTSTAGVKERGAIRGTYGMWIVHVCVHCWWADVYADEKGFGNAALLCTRWDEIGTALSQSSTHGSCGPHDAADKSVSVLNATAVWMRECKMNGRPPRSWFSPWTSHHSSWLILCAASLRKSQVALIQWHWGTWEMSAVERAYITCRRFNMLLRPCWSVTLNLRALSLLLTRPALTNVAVLSENKGALHGFYFNKVIKLQNLKK